MLRWVDGTANKQPLPVEDLGLCKHYLLIALICEFFHLILFFVQSYSIRETQRKHTGGTQAL